MPERLEGSVLLFCDGSEVIHASRLVPSELRIDVEFQRQAPILIDLESKQVLPPLIEGLAIITELCKPSILAHDHTRLKQRRGCESVDRVYRLFRFLHAAPSLTLSALVALRNARRFERRARDLQVARSEQPISHTLFLCTWMVWSKWSDLN